MVIPSSSTQEIKLCTYKGLKSLNGAKNFESGNDVIDRFVRKKNLNSQGKAPGSTVFVLIDTNENDRLVGFCTLTSHSLSKDEFSNSNKNVGKTTSIPVVKLGMLGVDKYYQKKGLGRDLVLEALTRTKLVGEQIGCAGIFLQADAGAVSFYKNLGFSALDEADEKSGVVPMFLHVDGIP